MALPNIVAICGSKRAGKDVIAMTLVKHHGYMHMKFANPLKNMIKELFDLRDVDVETDAKDVMIEKYGATPRRLMQFIGTEVFQNSIQQVCPSLGRTFWARKLVSNIPEGQRIVISDLRFPHEVNILREYSRDTKIIKVSRPKMSFVDEHCSELEFHNIIEDVLILNDSDVETLQARVVNEISKILV
jgi:hypothetical protein